MKKYLLITLMAIALSATAQQTPTNKTRSNSDYSQVDSYLIGLKRLGIPTSETDNLDASGLPQNTVKIIFNTTLGRLRIYNPVSGTWTDASSTDLSQYLPLTGGALTGRLIVKDTTSGDQSSFSPTYLQTKNIYSNNLDAQLSVSTSTLKNSYNPSLSIESAGALNIGTVGDIRVSSGKINLASAIAPYTGGAYSFLVRNEETSPDTYFSDMQRIEPIQMPFIQVSPSTQQNGFIDLNGHINATEEVSAASVKTTTINMFGNDGGTKINSNFNKLYLTATDGVQIKTPANISVAELGESYNTFHGAVIADNLTSGSYNYFNSQDIVRGKGGMYKSSGWDFYWPGGGMRFAMPETGDGNHNITFALPAGNATVAYTYDIDDKISTGAITNNQNDYAPQDAKVHINGTVRSNGIGSYYGAANSFQLGVNGEALYINAGTTSGYFGSGSLLFQDSNNESVFAGMDDSKIFWRNKAGNTSYRTTINPYNGVMDTNADFLLPKTGGTFLTEQKAAGTFLANTGGAINGYLYLPGLNDGQNDDYKFLVVNSDAENNSVKSVAKENLPFVLNNPVSPKPGGNIYFGDFNNAMKYSGNGLSFIQNGEYETGYIRSGGGGAWTISGGNTKFLFGETEMLGISDRIYVSAPVQTSKDIEIIDATKGIIMKSQNGTRYRITIDDAGDFVKTAL